MYHQATFILGGLRRAHCWSGRPTTTGHHALLLALLLSLQWHACAILRPLHGLDALSTFKIMMGSGGDSCTDSFLPYLLLLLRVLTIGIKFSLVQFRLRGMRQGT